MLELLCRSFIATLILSAACVYHPREIPPLVPVDEETDETSDGSSGDVDPGDANSGDANSGPCVINDDCVAPATCEFGSCVSLPVALDPTFNGTGVLLLDYVDDDGVSKDDVATSVAIDSAGRIVVSGSGMYIYYADDDQFDMAAITLRLLPSGQLDATYQHGAQSVPGMTVDHESRWSHGMDVLVDSADNVVLCGYREWSSQDDPTLYRYLAGSGTPDLSFGSTGVVGIPVTGEVQGSAMAYSPTDGTYVVAADQQGQYVTVAKVGKSAGQTLTSFGSAGTIGLNSIAGAAAEDILVDPLGRILVAGSSGSGFEMNLVVWRRLSDGSADTAFGDSGTFTYDGGGPDKAFALVLDASGHLLVVGLTTNPDNGSEDLVVARLSASNGALDTTFADAGIYRYDSGQGELRDEGHGAAFGPGGRLYVTGTTSSPTSGQCLGIWALDSVGRLVAAFGGAPPSTHPGVLMVCDTAGRAEDLGWDLAVDSAGALIVAGESKNADGYFSMAVWKISP